MSKETAALYLASLLLIVKVVYASIWDAISENVRAVFADGYVSGVFMTAGLLAFGVQVYFAFATGGASLLLSPIAWALDTAIIGGIVVAVSAFVASIIGLVEGLYNGWKTWKAVSAVSGLEENFAGYSRTPSGRAWDWSGAYARRKEENEAEAAAAAAAVQSPPAMKVV